MALTKQDLQKILEIVKKASVRDSSFAKLPSESVKKVTQIPVLSEGANKLMNVSDLELHVARTLDLNRVPVDSDKFLSGNLKDALEELMTKGGGGGGNPPTELSAKFVKYDTTNNPYYGNTVQAVLDYIYEVLKGTVTTTGSADSRLLYSYLPVTVLKNIELGQQSSGHGSSSGPAGFVVYANGDYVYRRSSGKIERCVTSGIDTTWQEIGYPSEGVLYYSISGQSLYRFVADGWVQIDVGLNSSAVNTLIQSALDNYEWDNPQIPAIDESPVPNSENLVTSGGVYNAVADKQDAITFGAGLNYDNETHTLKSTATGASAYDIYCQHFREDNPGETPLSETEWLDQLKGSVVLGFTTPIYSTEGTDTMCSTRLRTSDNTTGHQLKFKIGTGTGGGTIVNPNSEYIGHGDYDGAYNAYLSLGANDKTKVFEWLLEQPESSTMPEVKKLIWHVGNGVFIDAFGSIISNVND